MVGEIDRPFERGHGGAPGPAPGQPVADREALPTQAALQQMEAAGGGGGQETGAWVG